MKDFVDTKKAQKKKLRAFVERHKQTIGTKAEIIVEHFNAIKVMVGNPEKWGQVG